VSVFKKIIFGEDTSRHSLEASPFLNMMGVMEKMNNYNFIRIFCSHKKPLFLPYYVPNKLFIIEVARQYKFWFHVLYEKGKNNLFLISSNYTKLNYFKVVILKINFHFWKLEFWIFEVCNYYFMIVGQNFDLPTTLF